MYRRSAFEVYLRTGRRLAQVETKFNPNHDPKDGRFTFAGHGDQSGNSSPPRRPARTSGATQHPEPASKKKLGSLSAQYETSGQGVSTVSSGKTRGGKQDPGGVSYGSYQMTSQTPARDKAGHVVIVRDGGSVANFLTKEGALWASQFAGLKPGSEQFSNVWKKIAATDAEALHAAEHAYIKRTRYDPAVERIKSATHLDVDEMAPAVQDVLWSTAVQHGAGSATRNPGGATRIFLDAIKNTDSRLSRNSQAYSSALINNVYSRRTRYWPRDHVRYKSELQRALRMLGKR